MRIVSLLASVILLFGCRQSSTLFESLSSSKTNILFSNNIEISDTFNILESQYLYNGGGVGIGDFNNDGLEDLYFTGNHVDSKLYLNSGNLEFEDISEEAGVSATGLWSSGVSLVDINTDGNLDIYVNNTTHPDSSDRVNHLYINQGIVDGYPKFEEQGKAYGLDVDNYTVNSAFFDYDKDGDLDVFMIINEQGSVRGTIAYQKRDPTKTGYQRIDKLFRNDWDDNLGHPVFTEVTKEAGINAAGFSLGVNITDINNDGWKDIYISNDFISDNVIYINNGDGTFRNEAKSYLKHTAHSAMGNDVVDINNDGYNDIIELDMLPEDNYRQKRLMGPINYTTYINNEKYDVSYQYVRNALQLNPGNESDDAIKYSDISLLAGIAATDWSWTPLVADFDHDGLRDVIVTNGFPKDVTDRDYIDYRADAARYSSPELMLSKIPSVEIHNYAFKNNGDLTFGDVSAQWGLTENTFSNGAAYGDLDNDGDLDIVINNIDLKASILENQTNKSKVAGNWIGFDLIGNPKNPDALGATIRVETNQDIITYEHSIYRGYLSSHSRNIHIGLGDRKVESISITWPDGSVCHVNNAPLNQRHIVRFNDCEESDKSVADIKAPLFSEIQSLRRSHFESDFVDYNIQPLLPYKLSQFGPSLAVGDVDDNGLEDIYVGGPAFTDGYFMLQQANNGFLIDSLKIIEPKKEQMGTLLLDIDGDDDLDMYVVCGSYEFEAGDSILQDQLIINEKGTWVNHSDKLPSFFSSGSCARAADYDQDGDLDIFVGGRVENGEYPSPVNSYLIDNNSSGKDLQFDLNNQSVFDNLGMVTDALWSDYNGDGWIDLIVAREYEPILILVNEKGIFRPLEVFEDRTGFWCSLASGDVDNDGDIDYILGNRGKNTFNKVSSEHPFKIFVNDFDKNGSTDAIPMAYFKDREGGMDLYPTVSRGDFAKEINSIRKKYPSYNLYAQLNRDLLFTDSTIAVSDIYEVNYTATSILFNDGNDQFSMKALNTEAQLAPIFGMRLDDFNGDSNLDILMVGNDFGSELIFGRMDALNGLLLIGDGKGNFESEKISSSGFYVPGDGKSVVTFSRNNKLALAVGENMGSIRIFDSEINRRVVESRPLEYLAKIKTTDGNYLREISYGTGFLSQSSRNLLVPSNTEKITFVAFDGQERSIDINE